MPDLGSDKIWRLGHVNNTVGQWQINGYIQQPAGSGPRHIQTIGEFANVLCWRPLTDCLPSASTIYTVHEISNTLTEQTIPPTPGNDFPTLIGNLSTLPADIPAGSTYNAAELLISPQTSDPQRYLYASNRNVSPNSSQLDPLGDTIAIFSTSPTLKLVQQVHTGLQQIRGMKLSADGKYLIAAGLTGGGIAVFEVIDCGANLALRGRYTDTGSTQVSSFVWL